MFGWLWLFFSGGKPGFGPAAELLFFASPKKSNQKKGEPRPCPSGSLRYSQRSGHLQTRFAQTVQVPSSERCSVAQHVLMAGGYLSARPLRGPRPNGLFASRTSPEGLVRCAHLARGGLLVRCAHLAGLGRLVRFAHLAFGGLFVRFASLAVCIGASHSSFFIPSSHSSICLARISFLIPHSCNLTPGQPQGLPLHPHSSLLQPHPRATTRVAPTPSPLTRARHAVPLRPHPSPLTPHPSLLTPHSSLLTPHSSLLTPHSSLLTPHSSLLTPHSSLLTPHSSLLTPHSSLLTPHSSLLTPHSSLLTPRSAG